MSRVDGSQRTVASGIEGPVLSVAFHASRNTMVINATSVQIVTVAGAVSTLFTGSAVSFDGVAVDTVRHLYNLADSSGDRLFSRPFAGAVSTPLGSYDYDSGFFVAGMVFDGVDTLLMATGESSLTIVARSPLP